MCQGSWSELYRRIFRTGKQGNDSGRGILIRSILQAMAETERVCSSVNVGSTKTGINMDAVKLMGEIVLATAEATKEQDSLGCAKLVVP